jgi:hypothetical protein
MHVSCTLRLAAIPNLAIVKHEPEFLVDQFTLMQDPFRKVFSLRFLNMFVRETSKMKNIFVIKNLDVNPSTVCTGTSEFYWGIYDNLGKNIIVFYESFKRTKVQSNFKFFIFYFCFYE